MSENLCGSCQRCCQRTKVAAADEDIARWKKQKRYDILLCLEKSALGGIFLMHKVQKQECFFLTEKGCSIYDTRPEVCRAFPQGWLHVKQFGCKINPKTKQKISDFVQEYVKDQDPDPAVMEEE